MRRRTTLTSLIAVAVAVLGMLAAMVLNRLGPPSAQALGRAAHFFTQAIATNLGMVS